MRITKLYLKNIRCYAEQTFMFNNGIIAISGSNGAGKSTIIDSIGLCLFDSAANPLTLSKYFLRYGCKKGEIDVYFSVGDTAYIMKCGVGKAGKTRALFGGDGAELTRVRGDRDIDAFLSELIHARQQPAALFSNVIGARQGSFCEPFLLANSERVERFNKILGIDSYAQAGKRAGEVNKCFERAINELSLSAAELKTDADRAPELRAQREALEAEITAAAAELEEKRRQSAKASAEKKRFDELLRARDEAENGALIASQQLNTATALLRAENERLAEASAANERALSLFADFERYRAIREESDELELLRSQRDALSASANKAEREYAAEASRLEANRLSLATEAERLKEEAFLAQTELEKLLAERSEAELSAPLAAQAAKEATARLQSANDARAELPASAPQLLLNEKQSALAVLQSRKKQLAAQQKKLERGECPYTNERCEQLSRLSQTAANELLQTEREIAACMAELAQAEEALQKHSAALYEAKNKAAAERDFAEKAARLASEALSRVNSSISGANERLQRLQKRQSEQINREKALSAEQTALQAAKSELEQKREKLCAFDGLNERLEATRANLAAAQPLRDEYVRARDKAEALPKLEESASELKNQQSECEKRLATAQSAALSAREAYSASEHERLSVAAEALISQCGALSTAVSMKREQSVNKQNELLYCEQALREYERIQTELQKRKKAAEKARLCVKILNEAGERLGGAYRRSIGEAANEYCRAISDTGASLVWQSGYDVAFYDTADGAPRERWFRQLSGGEQMSAALSLRLALLTKLSSANIAFFDEPTAGLDNTRREALSQLLPAITRGFEQVFVVSHDDTFDAVAFNTIAL